MNRETKMAILIALIMLLAVFAYVSPYFINNIERKNNKVSANAEIFTSKVLSQFNVDKNLKASVVAKQITEELNKINKNPYSKKQEAYVYENAQAGQLLVEFDDAIQTITITSYDKDKKIIIRTLIKPPSFVTYKKEEVKNERK